MVTPKLALTCCKLVSHLHSCRVKFAVSLQICSASLLQTKIAIWGKLTANLTRQKCKLMQASKSPWDELAASNSLQKQSTNTTRDRTRDLRFRSRRANHSASYTLRGGDRFR
ncbi:hypothetical protein AVEN_216661-1 [Araneus ventricosus]|uniref:Uncharacterized protein n=1 Tax=Araneus ventricosus TaxID=182803 RepID=A0A4Y2DTQ8_ARAVE|nr:hypothetical protein AVEN_216661-1 [Araneus ventricosus]